MSTYPYVHLARHPSAILVTTGAHFHAVDLRQGELLCSTRTLDEATCANIIKSGSIRCVAFDDAFTHIATTGDDKKLKVWKVNTTEPRLELLSERELPKKPTALLFTRDGAIVVSDKFGDVFSYPLNPTPPSATVDVPLVGASKRGSLTSHENPSNGTLILGHASLVTTFVLTPDERYIITADRDEHIRVSWFPQGYAVERYCLGHKKFVNALHIPPSKPNVLVSGGGDPVLKVWDWMTGALFVDVPVQEVAEPFVVVKAPKRRRDWSDGDDGGGGGGDEAEEGQPQKKGKGRRRRRGKDKAQHSAAEKEGSVDAEGETEKADNVADGEDVDVSVGFPEAVLVFVVNKIQSVNRGSDGCHILFSVVGATALFYTILPEGETSHPVHAVDLGASVVDFTIDPDESTVWVSLDAASATSPEASSPVRLLSWSGSTLIPHPHPDSAPALSLLATSPSLRVPASDDDLKALDLYGALTALPKNVDPAHDPHIRDGLAEAAAVDEEGLTLRELGRLKKKRALLARIQEKERAQQGCGASEEAGPEAKKARSETGEGEGQHEGADVEMEGA
ncbi:WD40-repeat-containing domain protein [Epithele typhae]|uniref:WD40-repeat-containing domain protein n=1 Tax=Epithele typhae TaxID=378194 RepID=UPI002007748E|nr:WD40-repeat-containing domain protein [Epithele typhae]KAH9926247.1 WD40-repeat-containing domain protein [Epithele typhae]